MEGDGGRRETRIACRTVDFLSGTHRDAQSLGRGIKEAGGTGSTRQRRSGPKTDRRSALEGGSPGLGTAAVGPRTATSWGGRPLVVPRLLPATRPDR